MSNHNQSSKYAGVIFSLEDISSVFKCILSGLLFIFFLTSCKKININEVAGPEITNVSPAMGTPGTIITLTGTHFGKTTTDNRVSFDGINVQVLSAAVTELIIAAPAHIPGVTEVKLMVNGKESRVVYFEYE